MNIVNLSMIFSTLFAGCSVIVAIYIYHRNAEREYFRGFRGSLVNYRQLLDEASELFDEIGLVEIGYSISKQLRNICPSNLSPQETEDFFYDEENEDYLKQAIYLGIGESKTIARAKEISRDINRVPTAHRETFPITNASIGILNAYYSAMVNTVSSGELISDLFTTARENRHESDVSPALVSNTDLIFREIGIYITLLHTNTVNNLAESLFEHSDTVAGIISHTYESKSDSELRKISNQEKTLIDKFDENGKYVNNSKVLFEYLKFYKPYLTEDDWDRLVECKTLMEAAVDSATEE